MDKARTKRERRLTVNNSNLIPNTERSPEELREMGRKGGIASGKARRRKRDLQKLAKMLLDKQTAESFKEILGMSFINYAAFYIHRRMQMCVDNNRPVRLGYNMGALVRKRKRIDSQYASIYGVEPTDKEMRYFLGVTEEMLENIKKASRMGNIASLDAPIETVDGELSVMDVVASDECLEEDVCRRIDRENMERELWLAVDRLPGNQSRVLRLRYQNGLTLDETGKSLGVNRENVRQLQAKAFRLLRTKRRGAKLQKYCEEYLSAVTVPHVGVRGFHYTWTSEVEREAIKEYEKSRGIL